MERVAQNLDFPNNNMQIKKILKRCLLIDCKFEKSQPSIDNHRQYLPVPRIDITLIG